MNPFVPDFILQQDAQDAPGGAFEAAALFVDISGFTVLTESLVPHGREGAECLASALRFYFDPIVSAVHEAGGFITGFAGDACAAIFPQSPHRNVAAHALDAAQRMQRFVAEQPVYRSAYGAYPFSIRVGLSWGRVGWGIVRVVPMPLSDPRSTSDPRSGLSALSVMTVQVERAFAYFHGPAVDGCAAVEHRAAAGEVLFDADFRRRVPGIEAMQVGAMPRGPGAPVELFRCLHPVQPLPRLSVTWTKTVGQGAHFLAPGLSELPPQGEFRDVVSVFLSFGDVSDVPGLIRLLNELATGYGGTFTGLNFGDKGTNALIHFGAPVSHENDTERALDFVLELHRSYQRVTPLRAGITRDVRYVGWNGGTLRKEFACLGRATNLAARLMMNAGWGDLLCDPKVFADAAASYDFDPRGEMTLKGFENPVQVHALESKRASFDLLREFSAKELVGRSNELKRLLSSIEPIFVGRFAGVIHVDGEAGLGKSYLVETARRNLEERGLRFLWIEAPCDQTLQRSLNAFEAALKEYFQQSPAGDKLEDLEHFNEIFAALQARVPPSLAALVQELDDARSIFAALLGHRIPGSLYERLSPKDRFDRTIRAIVAWVRVESASRPMVIHIEDAHWADGDTIRAIGAIARLGYPERDATNRLPLGPPVTLLCTARYKDDGGPFRVDLERSVPIRTIPLGPLSPDDIGKIAERLGGRPVPELFRSILIEGAGGNPFFAEEIFSYWCDNDAPLVSEASVSSPSVALLPSDVNSLLVARLDRLPPPVKLTVLAAAVLGKEFDVGILSAMAAGDPEVVEHVRFAEGQRIFQAISGTRYRFRNTLLRNAAYEIQARARLARLHLLAAQAIEAAHQDQLERHAPELGRHYRRAGQADKARRYILTAAREATSRYAHTEARRYYKSYFRLIDEPTPESVVARYELARDVYEPRGDLLRAAEEHLKAIEEARHLGDGASEALGLIGLGRVAWAERRFDEAANRLAAALTGARRSDNRWAEALALAHLGLVHKAQGHGSEAQQVFETALRIGEQLRMHETSSLFGNMVAYFVAGSRVTDVMRLYEHAVAPQLTAATGAITRPSLM